MGEVRGAHYRDEDLCRADLAGQAVDDHRHRVAGVIDEQLVAAGMDLPHRHRKPRLPAPVEFAETRVAVTGRLLFDVFVPQDRQCDVLALQLAVDLRPIRLGLAAVPLLGADGAEKPGFQHRIGNLGGQRPAQTGGSNPL
jgi:hypothetical protein